MNFLEQLRAYLRNYPRHPVIAEERCRRQFLVALQQAEDAGESADWLRQQHKRLGPHVVEFGHALSRRLAQAGVPAVDIPSLVDKSIALTLGRDGRAETVTRMLLLEEAVANLGWPPLQEEPRPCWLDVGRYAREIQAVRRDNGSLELGPIGRVLNELSGREAVRWLLHVEVAQSTGHNDPWRVNRGRLRRVLEEPEYEEVPWGV